MFVEAKQSNFESHDKLKHIGHLKLNLPVRKPAFRVVAAEYLEKF
jgi:hypothetical protein